MSGPSGNRPATSATVDSPHAWWRLAAALTMSTIGGVGMWSVVVALPAVQADFGVARGAASLPYTLTMLCFGLAGIAMGRLTDRFGIVLPIVGGTLLQSMGFVLAGATGSVWQFALVQGLLIGTGSSATFGPLIADISQWFVRRRGAAIGIMASGSYLAGAVWPPVVQLLIDAVGWRRTYLGIGVFCAATMLALARTLRRPPPAAEAATASGPSHFRRARPAGLSPAALQALLIVAGVACCVAMSMPQVHIVAYCGDLGHGATHGAHMLALLLGAGVVSRLFFGWVSDRTGGLPTLLLGSGLQAITLALFLPFQGLAALYAVSVLFGLAQGGIVPSYAMIVREYFSPREAGERVGTVIMATVFGMALGGWLSGLIFDLTGSYRVAFVNGIAWNALNFAIAALLWLGARRRPATAV
jgi:MFS family permease